MEGSDGPYGVKFLLYSSVTSLIATILPYLMVISALQGGSGSPMVLITLLATLGAVALVEVVLGAAAIFFLYKGWSETCIDFRHDLFCKVAKVIKYGILLSVLSVVGFAALNFSALTSGKPDQVLTILVASSPLLIIAGLSALAVWLFVAYGYYTLGSITYVNYVKFGGILTVLGPVVDSLATVRFVPVPVLSLVAYILLIMGLRQIMQGAPEGAPGGYEEYEEEYERPRRVRRRPEYEELRYDDEYRYERELEGYYEEETVYEPRRIRRVREEWEVPRPREARREYAPRESEGAHLIGPRGTKFPLSRVTVFGRKDFAGLIPDEELQYISRRHFEIRQTPKGYVIKDLNSTNGTWVDGKLLDPGEEYPLREGSVIDVAEVIKLKFVSGRELGVPSI